MIVCESLSELDILDALARCGGLIAPVMIRVNPAFAVMASSS